MNIKKLATVFILSILLTACTGIKFTYNNISWFLPWYLDDYLVLNNEQEQEFDQHFNLIWQWHRKKELPQYSEFLHEIVNDIDTQQLNLERLHYYSEQAKIYYARIVQKTLEQGSGFIAGLNDQQITELLDSMADDDDDFKEYVADTDAEERIKERQKYVNKTFRKWLGKLSKKQKQRINQWSTETETTLEHQLLYIEQNRTAFKSIITNRKNIPATKQQLIKLITQPELLRSKKHNEIRERNLKRFRQLIVDMFNSLSKKQTQRFRKKILGYAEDFAELSRQDIN